MEDRRTIPGALVETIYLLVIGFLTYKQSLPTTWCGGLLLGYAIKSGYVSLSKQHAKIVGGLTGIDLDTGPTSTSQRMRAVRAPRHDDTDDDNTPRRTQVLPDPPRDPRTEPRGDWKPPRSYRHRLAAAVRRAQGFLRPALPALYLLAAIALYPFGLPLPRS